MVLLILTAITVGASYINFGSGNIVIALAIATVKAIIVGLIFMHLLHDKPVNAVIAVAGFVFLGIFLMFDFIDVGTRTDPQPTNFPLRPRLLPPPPVPPPLRPPPPTKEKSRKSSAQLPPTPTSRKPASCLKNTPPPFRSTSASKTSPRN